jgi:four helix bundle protein
VQDRLDHEKLDVYRLELDFVGWSTDLMAELMDSPAARTRRIAETCDHLDRSALSALFNTAEGNGRRPTRTRAKFFDDARGSATECAACLDALVAKRACTERRIEEGKSRLVRIVSMLARLVDRFSLQTQVKEECGPYGDEREDNTPGAAEGE